MPLNIYPCILFLRIKLTIFQHQAIIWNNDGKFAEPYMRHSALMSYVFSTSRYNE